MPRGDRTGPEGMGPMTGRRAGFCAGYDVPGYAYPGSRRGYGRSRGMYGRPRDYGWGGGARGWRHLFYATGRPRWARPAYADAPVWDVPLPPTKEQQLQWLQEEAGWLKDQLDAINERIGDLERE